MGNRRNESGFHAFDVADFGDVVKNHHHAQDRRHSAFFAAHKSGLRLVNARLGMARCVHFDLNRAFVTAFDGFAHHFDNWLLCDHFRIGLPDALAFGQAKHRPRRRVEQGNMARRFDHHNR